MGTHFSTTITIEYIPPCEIRSASDLDLDFCFEALSSFDRAFGTLSHWYARLAYPSRPRVSSCLHVC